MKQNPKKIPKTQADVDRAWQAGADFGCEFCLNNILLVLKDKHGGTDEEVLQLRKEFMDQIDSINKGYCTYADVKNALKSDYDLKVSITTKNGR